MFVLGWLTLSMFSPRSPLKGKENEKEEEKNVEGQTCPSASHVSFLFPFFFFFFQRAARGETEEEEEEVSFVEKRFFVSICEEQEMDKNEDKASKTKKGDSIGFGFYFRHRWNFIQSLYMVFTWIVLVRLCRRLDIGQNRFLLSGMPSGVGRADDGHLSLEHQSDLFRDGLRFGHAIVRILHCQYFRGIGFARCSTPFRTSVDHRLFLCFSR